VYLRRHLMVRSEYGRLILEGVKKATIRLGVVIPKYYDEVIVHSGGRPIAKVRIVDVIYKRVSQLTDEDAKLDGFNNVSELVKALKEVYGDFSPNDTVTIIKFEVIQRLDELKTYDRYHGLSPSDIARIGLRYLKSILNDDEIKILKVLGSGLSIREAAKELYGSVERRWRIRRVVRRVADELVRRGIIRIVDRDYLGGDGEGVKS